ncbi:MAG: phage holin family protein, partial [Candidatus Daviesbacteria bacterium]|nr:phage holin family protein [Candidatus Daviesbacteria bacterium]
MKSLLRNFLINMSALWITSQLIPSLIINDGMKGLALGALAFMLSNILLVPLMKILFLPLNLLTLGIFAWLVNVLALYFLVIKVPSFQVFPYSFPGATFGGFIIMPAELTTFQVAIVAS